MSEEERLFRNIRYSLGESADHLSMSHLSLMTSNLLSDLKDHHWVIVRDDVIKDVDMEETTG